MSGDGDSSSDVKRCPTGDYAVGYCRTPEHTRWQRGQSGNPRGRPKRKLTSDLGEAAEQALSEIVSIVVRGKPRRMTLAQAIMYKAAVNGAAGDARSRRDLIQLQRIQRERDELEADIIIEAKLVLEDDDGPTNVTEKSRNNLVETSERIPDRDEN